MKKFIKNPLVILAVAVVLLAGSSIGATRAAVVYQSARDDITFRTAQIGVELRENGKSLGEDNTLSLGFDDNKFVIGKTFTENVSVVNNSSEEYKYDEYVRVIVTKSWVNADGTKNTTLAPELIQLGIEDGWVPVEGSNKEQTTYYMLNPLEFGKEAKLINSLTVKDEITKHITNTTSGQTITTTYDYNGKSFMIEVEVDAVQTHNAKDAIKAAWGIDVTVSEDGTISLQ